MNTCSGCRGSPTEMVCSLIRTTSRQPVPRIILDLIRQKPTDYPMVLATPADFGCSLHEDQSPDPDRRQERPPLPARGTVIEISSSPAPYRPQTLRPRIAECDRLVAVFGSAAILAQCR